MTGLGESPYSFRTCAECRALITDNPPWCPLCGGGKPAEPVTSDGPPSGDTPEPPPSKEA